MQEIEKFDLFLFYFTAQAYLTWNKYFTPIVFLFIMFIKLFEAKLFRRQ